MQLLDEQRDALDAVTCTAAITVTLAKPRQKLDNFTSLSPFLSLFLSRSFCRSLQWWKLRLQQNGYRFHCSEACRDGHSWQLALGLVAAGRAGRCYVSVAMSLHGQSETAEVFCLMLLTTNQTLSKDEAPDFLTSIDFPRISGASKLQLA